MTQARTLSSPIVGPSLVLRQLTIDDADLLYNAVNDSRAELSRWLPWCHAGYSKHDTVEFLARAEETWRRGEEYALGIFDAAGTLRGGTGLNFVDLATHRANLGYWVTSDFTGKGIATIAARLLAAAALNDLELERIEILVAVGNVASQRVAEKAGARREGVLRRRIVTPGGQSDAVCFSLIRSDFGLPARGE